MRLVEQMNSAAPVTAPVIVGGSPALKELMSAATRMAEIGRAHV